MTVSPQSASMVGSGRLPLTSRTGRETPSGAAVVLVISSQYSLVTPVSGAWLRCEYPIRVHIYVITYFFVVVGESIILSPAIATVRRILTVSPD
jgi:hypothetical protein